jgi:hypothetical protein
MKRVALISIIACLAGFGCSSSSSDPTPEGTAGTGGSSGADSGTDTGTDSSSKDSAVADTGKPQDGATQDGANLQDKDGDGYKSDVDCNDNDINVHPGATEICNGIDDNCNGQIDEDGAVGGKSWYADTDGDGYGDPNQLKAACSKPTGYVDNSSDCNDKNADINPKATEACNGVDDNCDGQIDESGALGSTAWYPDKDSDGFGDDTGKVTECKKPAGYVADGGDCNDNNANVNPAKLEICGNQIDDNCDGLTDDPTASDAKPIYPDNDGDSFGGTTTLGKACTAPSGAVFDKSDCDDTNNAIHPGAADMPDANSIDANCDGIDGDLASAIFVSVSGQDTNSGLGVIDNGTLTVKPVKTIAHALALAAATTPKRYVLVSEGEYSQANDSLVLEQGVSIYGGYSTSWVDRSLTRTAVTIFATGAKPTVSASAITEALVLDRLTIRGPDLTSWPDNGVESVAMMVSNTGTQKLITLSDVQIQGGTGSPGKPGTDVANAASGDCTCPGGAGATPQTSADMANGLGYGAAGTCGNSSAGGKDGSFYYQCYCAPVPSSIVAGNGEAGTGGQSCSAAVGGGTNSVTDTKGTFNATDWTPVASGTSGALGTNGGGGGGGGAGGLYVWCCDYGPSHTTWLSGGKGGAGGAGGCGANGVGAGSSGGAAFGLVLVQSTVDFAIVDIHLGTGGVGGKGGQGGNGLGGAAATAGASGSSDDNHYGTWAFTAKSGNGAAGGSGGAGCGGGGGAGGHGGWSIGLARVGDIQLFSVPTYSAGAAGLGGIGGTGGKSGDGTITSTSGVSGLKGTMVNDQKF